MLLRKYKTSKAWLKPIGTHKILPLFMSTVPLRYRKLQYRDIFKETSCRNGARLKQTAVRCNWRASTVLFLVSYLWYHRQKSKKTLSLWIDFMPFLIETRRHQTEKWQACGFSYELLTGLWTRISIKKGNSYPDPGVKIKVKYLTKLILTFEEMLF